MSIDWARRIAKKNRFLWILQNADSATWWSTLVWCGFSLLGGLFPSLASLLLTLLFGRRLALNEFIAHGEFALYSTASLAMVLYQVIRFRESKPVLGSGTALITAMGLLASATLYIGVQGPGKVNYLVLRNTSIILLTGSFMLAAMVTLVDTHLNNVSVSKAESEEEFQLNAKFNTKAPVAADEVVDIRTYDEEQISRIDQDLKAKFTSTDSVSERGRGPNDAR